MQALPNIINVKSFFWAVSLFRDLHLSQWSWGGGVLWTLEIEFKFYIFIAFAYFILNKRPFAIVILGIICILIFNIPTYFTDMSFEQVKNARHLNLFTPIQNYTLLIISNLSLIGYFVLMLTGALCAMHYLGEIKNLPRLLLYIAPCMTLFNREENIGLIIFCTLYLGRNLIVSNKVIDFFSNISYPLYLIHPAGYPVVSYLYNELDFNAFSSYFITLSLVIFLSFLVHIFVEKKAILFGSNIAKKLTPKCFS